ncbi:MAG: hypothetical protein J3Q66DRAFT_350789 [Benniella sp.]|nr:MAG: hypothetical protein J3Q66DRAFT_350789 [Benniella sp.]
MMDLPELIDNVCWHLNRNDLIHCARVNKAWHTIATPHVWRDLSWLSSRNNGASRRAFCKVVLEDHHQSLLGHGNSVNQAPLSRPLSTLAKYGHWIQTLPALSCFRSQFEPGQGDSPTVGELFLHLLKRCSPDVRLSFLSVVNKDLDLLPADPMKTILDFSLPRLRRLFVQMDFHPSGQKLSKLVDLLDRCSTTLEVLELSVDITYTETKDVKEDKTEDEPNIWISLKELALHNCADRTDTKLFWPWLLGKCSRAERLKVHGCAGIVENLVQGMSTLMPNLEEIALGCGHHIGAPLEEEKIVELLSGPRKGWKTVRLGSGAVFKEAAMNALAKHFSTLEMLEMKGYHGVSNEHLVQVLRSCNNLHTLASNYPCSRLVRGYFILNAHDFIDLDHTTGLFRPWNCEGSLKVLKIRIINIPRPELKVDEDDDAIEEEYRGQGRKLQDRVYDRLARLTNLESLWLGEHSFVRQVDCLEMMYTRQGGLSKLSGLKKMKELSVIDLMTKIDVREVQWMTANWPRLRAVYGLHRRMGERAKRWLQVNRPDIKVKDP